MLEHETGKEGKGGDVGEGRVIKAHLLSAGHGTTGEQSSRMCLSLSPVPHLL